MLNNQPKYPRLYELYVSTKSRSNDVESTIRTGKANFDDWEQTLQTLGSHAWMDFLKKAERCNFTYDRIAGLKGLFELVNEAKGYVFLKKSGCGEIKFIPTDKIKTPDIEGKCDSGKIILEVKTINSSEENSGYLYWNSYNNEMTTRDVQTTLSEGFKKKLDAVCKDTVEKFEAYDNLDTNARHILFCIVELDTNCYPVKEEMQKQLEQYIRPHIAMGIEIHIEGS